MIDLQLPVIKGYSDGTHRLTHPKKTIEKAQHFAPVMGITRVANVTGLDNIGIPVVMSIRPNSRSVSVSQGKGLTLDTAKASGLMEAIELYHAETISLPLKQGSYEELRYTHSLVQVWRIPQGHSTHFDRYKPLYWVEGYDILNETPKWVPFELVHTNYTRPVISGEPSFVMTTNGLASGNHILEAIVHGINEVVERDATTLWRHLNQDKRLETLVNLDTVEHEACRWLIKKLDDAGIDVYAWDQPTDIGLPTFRCEIHQREQNPFHKRTRSAGFGTHLTREVALIRAITEAAQSRLTIISGARDDITYMDYETPNLSRHDREYIDKITNSTPRLDFEQLNNYSHQTFNEDIQKQLELLKAVGINEVVVVDLTRPEFNIPVVRVIIPGLEATIEIGADYIPGERARRILEQR